MQAFLKPRLLLTYSAPATELQKLIPECLTLDTFGNNAFVAVAMVQTKKSAPGDFLNLWTTIFSGRLPDFRALSEFKGKSYAAFTFWSRLLIKKKMEVLGNTFTHYNYSQTDIVVEEVGGCQHFFSRLRHWCVCWRRNREHAVTCRISIPGLEGSATFCGSTPLFTFNEQKKVLIIEGVRENWTPQPYW